MGDEIIDGERRQGKCRLEKNNLVGHFVRVTEKEPWKQRLIESLTIKTDVNMRALSPRRQLVGQGHYFWRTMAIRFQFYFGNAASE